MRENVWDLGESEVERSNFAKGLALIMSQTPCRPCGRRNPRGAALLTRPMHGATFKLIFFGIRQNFNSLRQLKRQSRVEIPQWLLDKLAPMKDDTTAVMNYGIKYSTEMCKQLFESGHVHGVHFYTLNRETSITEILEKIGMSHKEDELDSASMRRLPWMPSPAQARRGQMELVRPIFWTSRPRSYMIRTSNWDEFPNGRWGDSSAASFGELKDYHLVLLGTNKSKEELLNMWGRELNSPEDVFEVFVCYLNGNENRHGYKVGIS